MPRHDARTVRPGFSRVILPVVFLASSLAPGFSILRAQVLQTDIVSAYRDSDSAGAFSGLFQFGFSVEQQLNTVLDLGTGADFQLNAGNDALIFGSEAKLSYVGDLRATNSGYTHLRYRLDRHSPSGVDLFTQYQWDGPRGMRNRYLLGANYRYALWKDTSGSMDVAAGLMYEYERWGYAGIAAADRPSDQSPVINDHPRINTYVRYQRTLSRGVRLLLMNYVQARTDDHVGDPRIASSVHLVIDVNESLSLTVVYNSIYDFAPIVPIRHFYFDVANGIALKF
jgi:hypothetical protein